VPERRALLVRPVYPLLRRIHVDERQLLATGQQRGMLGEFGEYTAVHRGQLAHIAVGKRTQKRPQRGRGTDPTEGGRDRTVAQQPHAVDVIGTGDHPCDQRTDLHTRIGAHLGVEPNMVGGKLFQTNQLSQPRRRHQPGMRHKIRVIEAGASLAHSMQQLHLRGALSFWVIRVSATPIIPGQRALLLLRHAHGKNSIGGFRLRHAKDLSLVAGHNEHPNPQRLA
jgi:hypothetical protein